MLRGIKDYYEIFHRVRINDSLIYKAVILSERYINDRFLPDKAIDLLDEACTCANLRNKIIGELEIMERQLAQLNEKQNKQLMNETDNIDYEEIARIKAEILAGESKIQELRKLAEDNNCH
jgi:ATP-dependent Clp protease ATP-binding subunit ClpA